MSRRQRQRRQRHLGGKSKSPIVFTFGVLGMGAVIGVLAVFGWIASIAASVPSIGSLKPIDKGAISKVYAADGSLLGTIQSDNLRVPVTSDQLPKSLKDATVAIEDQRFYQHKGVDYAGVLRAAFINVTTGKTAQGGSTITMQLVRNLYISSEKTIQRKIREASLAQQLESVHNKDWILTGYLNDVPYGTVNGQTAVGGEAAAQVFFGRPAARLDLAQSALLAGLPQAPSQYNPFIDPNAARQRRADVLQKMASLHMITPEDAAAAGAEPLGVRHNDFYQREREPYVFDYVKDELDRHYGIPTVSQGGLIVRTSIEPKLQNLARKSIAQQLNQTGDPSSGVVSIDPATGYIRAMAASETYGLGQGRTTFNYAADAHRQPGSTAKLWVLMAALRKGMDPRSTYYDSHQLDFTDPIYGPIKVSTDDNQYYGSESVFDAVVHSDNTVFQQLDLDVGPPDVTKAAHDLGITTHLFNYPAEGLGGLTDGVTPLEQANAYATVASGGYHNTPQAVTSVRFPNGRVDLFKPHRVKQFTDGETDQAIQTLKANIQRGTGTAANISCPAAGKTGTTSSFKDAWFVGFTPRLTTAVWVGYTPNPLPMDSVHGITVFGGTFPAQIWHDYMSQAIGSDCGDFPPPSEPMSFQPFFGKYASQSGGGSSGGGSSGGGTSSSSGTYTGPQNGTGSGNGGTTYQPSQGYRGGGSAGGTGGGGRSGGGGGGTGGGGSTGVGTGGGGTGGGGGARPGH